MVTPRTDAEEDKHGNGNAMHAHCHDSSHLSGDFADFARQLETELAAMTALADRLAVIADNMTFVAYQPAVVREALAAYENHKKQTP